MAPTRVLIALAAVAGMATAACGGPPPVRGQFGAYAAQNQRLRLADGDTFTVYRVKHWTFTDGSSPALQLEYASHVPMEDTLRLRQEAWRIWPSFAAYVEATGVQAAVVTATQLTVRRKGIAWASRTSHFGVVANRGMDGRWYLNGPPGLPLPPADSAAPPIEAYDGVPLTPEGLRGQVVGNETLGGPPAR
jgi:hypothetical protein